MASPLPWHFPSAKYPRLADALLLECDSLDPFLLATKLSERQPLRVTQLLEHAVHRRPTGPALHALAVALEQSNTDRRRAYSLYSRAAAKEYPDSALRLARAYENTAPGVRRNALGARAMYALVIAKKPSAEALRLAASLLWRGALDLMCEPLRAACYLLRAAEEFGDVDAALKIGDALIEGCFGLRPDPKRAIKLFTDASAKRSKAATLKLARIYLFGTYGIASSPKLACRFYSRAVKMGCMDAAFEYANALRRGTNGVPIDPVRAVKLLETARESIPEASFALAYVLTLGMVAVKQDLTRASQLFLAGVAKGAKWDEWWTEEYATETWEAPDRERARAQLLIDEATQQCRDLETIQSIANILLLGRGFVLPNARRAGELYIRAINDAGDARSMRAVADILISDIPDLKADAEQALHIYNRAIDAGDALAMRDLGHVLYTGLHGIRADPEKAMVLWMEAGTKGAHLGTLRCARDALIKAGRYRQAVEMYNAAIELPNVDARAVQDLADLIRLEDPERAAELYRRSRTAESVCSLAEMLLWSEAGTKDEEEALRLCDLAFTRSSRARVLIVHILTRRAQASGTHPDLRRARRALKRAYERDGQTYVQVQLRGLREREENAGYLRSVVAAKKNNAYGVYTTTVGNY